MDEETQPMLGRHSTQSSFCYAQLEDEQVLDAAETIGAALKRTIA